MDKKSFLFVSLFSVAAFAGPGLEEKQAQLAQINERQDSLAEYASSTIIGKDDSPVSMSGDFYTRVRNLEFTKMSSLFSNGNKARTFFESGLTLDLGVNPNSYLAFWANLFFPFDFSGYFTNETACKPNQLPNNYPCKLQTHHSLDFYSTTLYESVTAAVDVRGGEFGARLTMGGVLWTAFSPLTVWERQAWPQFVSQFETYEWERNVSTYYKEKTFKLVEEGGRAFWSNREFGGLWLDIYKLPLGLSGQVVFSQAKGDDQGSRDGARALNSQLGEVELSGTLDFRSDVLASRIAKNDIGPMALGLNFVGVWNDRDIAYEQKSSLVTDFIGSSRLQNDPFLNDNYVISADIKGNITQKLYIVLDLATSFDDSTNYVKDETGLIAGGIEQDTYYKDRTTSKPEFAIYAKIQNKYGIPAVVEASYIMPEFYSPYGMTDYGRNRTWRKDLMPLGAGAYRYTPNLMGANVKLTPEFNRGRFNVIYAQHRQVEAGKDVLIFPYRLTGRNQWEATASWAKYNPALRYDDAFPNAWTRYHARAAGNKTYVKDNSLGGVRGGTWEMWEYFGNFESVKDAASGNITETAKWSSVLAFDMGYDIGHWFNTDRNIFLAANTSFSSISGSINPIPYSETASKTMLWSWFFQAEPAFAITENLHGILIGGFEIFRAPNVYGYSLVSQGNLDDVFAGDKARPVYQYMPINYLETAFGAGFDWDFAQRAGLHVRYKYATHRDENNSINDWKGHFINTEVKVWF
jgi:hypothetical protein